jgi:hypothetical protein
LVYLSDPGGGEKIMSTGKEEGDVDEEITEKMMVSVEEEAAELSDGGDPNTSTTGGDRRGLVMHGSEAEEAPVTFPQKVRNR